MGRREHPIRGNHRRRAALVAALCLVFGLFACEAGEERFEETNPGYGGYGDDQQGDSASRTGEDMDEARLEDGARQERARGSEVAQIDPDRVSDQELINFAAIFTAIEFDKIARSDDGAIGGGPPDDDQIEAQRLDERETTTVRRGGMEVDRYLGIQFLLQRNKNLRARMLAAVDQGQ